MSSRRSPLSARTSAAALIAVVAGVLVAAPASADVTAATSTTTASAVAGEATPLAGLTVSASTSGEAVSVLVSTDVGAVSVALSGTGASLDYGYASTGSEVAFSGTTTAVNAALETVTLTTPASAKGTDAEIGIIARPEGGVVYSPSNEHFYEYVPSGAITWTQARAAAQGRSYLGQTGYLATVPNAEVNNLITSRIDGAQNVWLGGQGILNHDSYSRVWEWVDGPLAGQHFTRCYFTEGSCYFLDNAGLYSNWSGGEPNNAGGNEPRIVTNWGSFSGLWNDLPDYSDAISGYVVEYGTLAVGTDVAYDGLAEASSSVALLGTPGSVTNLSATAGVGEATVSWDAPANDGGSAITEYTVTVTPAGGDVTDCSGTDTSCTVTGLTSGTAYSVSVVATNDFGDSQAATTTVTPGTAPGTPVGPLGQVLVGEPYSDQVTSTGYPSPRFEVTGGALPAGLSLDEDTGAITGTPTETGPWSFRITASNMHGSAGSTFSGTAGQVPAITTTTVGPFTWGVPVDIDLTATGSPMPGWDADELPPGLTLEEDGRLHGTPTTVGDHDLSVTATNTYGNDVETFVVTVDAALAGAPTIVGATPGDGTLTLDVTDPASDGGAAITGYEYTLDGGATWHTATEDDGTIVIEGLDNGTEYTVQVRAINEAGASTPSNEYVATPFTAPDAPAITVAEPGSRSVTLAFAAPVVDGGSEITGYEYSLDGGATWTTTPVGPDEEFTVYGLTNGTDYEATVRAINASGPGDPAAIATVTPVRGPVAVPSTDGAGDVVVNGQPVSTTTVVESDGWSVRGGGVTVFFAAYDAAGDPVRVDTNDGIDEVHRDGAVLVSGSGFAPGSTVDVWLLSEPFLLGEVTANEDGSFSAMFALPEGVDLGAHTIQVNGLSAAGDSVSVNTGITIVEAPVADDDELSSTGADLRPVGGAALLLVLGLGLVLVGRRREVAGADQG
ncbi:fibronectin type III domain-containing protein [Demequina muriae]|uniref:Fibronectin type III domain-containing protein n=1 Tax=Demequina muriae TaxID=3051664 RepID=A0ABT8GG18_9MICO|nr:fibronectin type III domain-containing protein [Demequina sp. EGI L300058]MDN4480370.1 fibronectin type III domain-containing protein [Demequina sp. EGI L300058]